MTNDIGGNARISDSRGGNQEGFQKKSDHSIKFCQG